MDNSVVIKGSKNGITVKLDDNLGFDELKDRIRTKFDNTLTQPLCQFYKGTLRSGQVLETESSVVILGDVNPGGKVIACGNVIVLGSLRGNIYAGANGNENAFVVALDMDPMQIKIADVIARSSDAPVVIKKRLKSKVKGVQPKIAYVFEGNIYVEDFAQDVLEDIHL